MTRYGSTELEVVSTCFSTERHRGLGGADSWKNVTCRNSSSAVWCLNVFQLKAGCIRMENRILAPAPDTSLLHGNQAISSIASVSEKRLSTAAVLLALKARKVLMLLTMPCVARRSTDAYKRRELLLSVLRQALARG